MSPFAIAVNAILIKNLKPIDFFPGVTPLDYKYLFTALKEVDKNFYSKFIKATKPETMLELIRTCPYALDSTELEVYKETFRNYLNKE